MRCEADFKVSRPEGDTGHRTTFSVNRPEMGGLRFPGLPAPILSSLVVVRFTQ